MFKLAFQVTIFSRFNMLSLQFYFILLFIFVAENIYLIDGITQAPSKFKP